MGRILLLFWLTISVIASALGQRVSGQVVSAVEPDGLPGVNIVVKGTNTGVITDLQGRFTIDIPLNGVLIFSFIGYRTQEVVYTGQASINVRLEEEPRELSEVVVTGYSSVLKKDITGSITSVDPDRYRELSINGVDQALQGQAAGVQVTQSSGTPGGGISVRIRGSTSIGASNRPLFIIDGIPVETGSLSGRSFGGQSDNALALFNPADYEAPQILKDASAKALYGSRASNGVIILTSKKGKRGSTRMEAEVQRGMIDPVKKVDLLNSKELLELQREAVRNAGENPDALGLIAGVTDAVNTDWLDEVFRRGIMEQYQISASGGDDNTTFYMNASYRGEEGVQLNNKFERMSFSSNLERKVNQKFTLGSNITLSRSLNKRVKGDNFLDGVYSGAIKSLPYYTPYDENGTLVWPGSPLYPGFPNFNPVAQAVLPRFDVFTTKVLASLNGTYQLLPELRLRAQTSIDYNDVTEDQYESSKTAIGGVLTSVGGRGYGIFNATTLTNFISNATLFYNKNISDRHHINVLAGTEVLQNFERSGSVQGRLFPSDDFTYIASAGIVDAGSSFRSRGGLFSVFSEVRYDFMEKILVTASMRADGSSNFGPGNKFGYFPAVSAAWRLSDEEFLSFGTISDLKLRASFGYSGNERIPAFGFLGTWSATTYNGNSGTAPGNIGNPNIRWETTQELNVGVDLGLWEDRVQATLDAYINNTSGLLLGRPYAATTGFASIQDNVGKLQNKGIELMVETVNIDRVIKWTTSINLSRNLNKVVALTDTVPLFRGYQAEGTNATNIVKVGEPLGTFIGLKFLGVNPATGDAIYDDSNNDGQINNDDAVVIGNAQPKLFGGVTNRVAYGRFDLSAFFQFSLGNKILNFANATLLNAGQDIENNQVKAALRRWRKPGDITDVPRYELGAKNNFNNLHSSRLVEDGSYLRLKNVNVGYQLSPKLADRLKLQSVRVFLSATNLWTLTRYSGADPEVSTLDGSTTAQGIDFFTLPQVRTVSVGLNASLK